MNPYEKDLFLGICFFMAVIFGFFWLIATFDDTPDRIAKCKAQGGYYNVTGHGGDLCFAKGVVIDQN